MHTRDSCEARDDGRDGRRLMQPHPTNHGSSVMQNPRCIPRKEGREGRDREEREGGQRGEDCGSIELNST